MDLTWLMFLIWFCSTQITNSAIVKMFAYREEVMSIISEEERKRKSSSVRVCDMFDPCFCVHDGEYGLYGPKLHVDTEPSKYVLLGAGMCRGVRRLEYNSEIVYTVCGKKGVPHDHREHCIVDNVWKYTSLEGKIGFCDDCWVVGAWGAPYGYYLPIDVGNSDYKFLCRLKAVELLLYCYRWRLLSRRMRERHRNDFNLKSPLLGYTLPHY